MENEWVNVNHPQKCANKMGGKFMVLAQGLYRHYKGKYYFVFEVAHHSETREALVVYQCLYEDYSWWVRPLSMFIETVSSGDEIKPRFAFVRSMTLNEAKNFSNKGE